MAGSTTRCQPRKTAYSSISQAAPGARVVSLGSALETRRPAAPFVGPVLDRASRVLDYDQLGTGPTMCSSCLTDKTSADPDQI